MSDKNLFPVVLASTDVQFHQITRNVKPSKKAKDEAVKAGKPVPEDKVHVALSPDFADVDNVVNFARALWQAAEAKKSGSAEQLLTKIFRSHLEDATERAFVTDEAGNVNVDDAKFASALASLTEGGQKSISSLKEEESELKNDIIELFQLAQKGADAVRADGRFSDEDALLLVINNRSNELHKLQVVIEARERARDEKAKKNEAKKAAPAA